VIVRSLFLAAVVAPLCLIGAIAASPVLAAEPAADPDAVEARLLKRYPGVAVRDGQMLRLQLAGEPLVLRSRTCSDDQSDCEEIRLDAVFNDGRIAGVAVSYYEGASYILYARGESIEVGDRPAASPDGRHLISGSWSDGHPSNAGISLIAVDATGMTLVRRVLADNLAMGANLRWIGPHCAAFEASIHTSSGIYGDGARGTWYLIADAPEWRLTQERAQACR